MSGIRLGAKIRSGLAALRLKARFALLVRGFASLALATVVLGLTSFGLDRTLRLSWDARAVVLVLAGTGLTALLFKRLIRPLSARLDDVELAREVERAHPFLGWRLLSAVQFASPKWEPGPEVSRELAACVVRDAEDLAAEVGFGDAVPAAPILRGATRGLVVTIAALALIWACPEPAATWFQRNVLLMVGVSWPRDTHLQVQALTAAGLEVQPVEGVYTVPRGVDLTVVVAATGVIPKRVYLDTEKTAEGGSDERLAMDGLGSGFSRLTLERVTSGFRFVARGGDGEVGPFEVRVLHRPWIESLTLDVTPPPYTGSPRRTFGLESSSVSLPRGTQIALRAQVSKPLRRAFVGQYALDQPIEKQIARVHTATVTTRPPGFEVAFTVERTAIYGIEVYDTDTLSLEQPTRFTVVAMPDQKPSVRLRLLGVGPNVTPKASVRFVAAAQDDYGVTAGSLNHLGKLGGETEPLKGERPLALGENEEVEGVLDLSKLRLEPKMALTLWASAKDTDPEGPNVGVSPSLQLRVVTAEQLLNELLRRLHEQRLELERMISQEHDLALGLSGADMETLARAHGAQRDVARTVLRAGKVIEGVVEEMRSNEILDASTWNRLTEQVSDPLRTLHDGKLADAAELADSAVEADGAAQVLAMGLAGEAASGVERELRAIVEHMGRLEELAELISLLKRIIRDQRKLLDETKQSED